jgi:hypothetical protein
MIGQCHSQLQPGSTAIMSTLWVSLMSKQPGPLVVRMSQGSTQSEAEHVKRTPSAAIRLAKLASETSEATAAV